MHLDCGNYKFNTDYLFTYVFKNSKKILNLCKKVICICCIQIFLKNVVFIHEQLV